MTTIQVEMLVLLPIAAMLVLGLAGFALAIVFVLPKFARDRAFPIKVPGWGTRLESHPPFDATVEDFALMNRQLLEAAVRIKGYDRKAIKRVIDKRCVRFVRRDDHVLETYGFAMHVIDSWGRKRANGEPMLRAAWNEGDITYLVWAPGATLDLVEYDHEVAHALHNELEGIFDYDHVDEKMFGPIGLEVEASKAFRAAKVRGESA